MSFLVSVIIPTFNRAPWVLEAAASVLNQTYRSLELIVVDDGSTDDTRERLQPLTGSLIYLYQDNRGVSAARNRGLREARGDWIAFLDSDDLWLPRKLEAQVRFFAENPGAEISQTEEIWIRHGRRANPRKKHQKFSGDIFAPSLVRCLVSPSAVMLRRRVLERLGGFDETLPACEDYDLWLKISCRQPIFLIQEALVIKRGGHADQLSRRIPTLDRYRIESLVRLLNSRLLTSEQASLAFQELTNKCRIYGQGCLKRGREEEGNYYLHLPEALKP